MDAATTRAVKTLAKAREAIGNLPMVGAEAYANTVHGKPPIVRGHFTPGNDDRYGWAPLSDDYAESKRGQITALRKGMKAAGRKVAKLGEDRFGSKALPVLVRSGKLRDAISATTHQILREGDVAIIVFAQLPVYALAHHTGTARLPRRSPVAPNAQDTEQVQGAMQRFLDRAIGTGGDVPVSATSIPSRARFI